MSQPVYLIDASIYIFRAYYSMPDQWHSPEGYPVNALYGYARFLLTFLHQTKAKRVACAFDESLGSCFRNDIYPDYKVSRALPDEALAFQLSACKSFTEILGVGAEASERYEADDIIAGWARLSRQHDQSVAIVTRDKDLGQLLSHDDDFWWDFAADKKINKASFAEHFGVRADQMGDYLALVGDSVDDVPGVPGIGAKTAAKLLDQFDSLDHLYENLGDVLNSSIRGAKRVVDNLRQYHQQVLMAKQLVSLHSTMPLALAYQDFSWKPGQRDEVGCFLEEFGLGQPFERQLARCYWWQS
jgi:5'-3' exonuclease